MNEMTVFFTTHYMEEAANADYVVIIDNGRIAQGDPVRAQRELFQGQADTFDKGPKSICRLTG